MFKGKQMIEPEVMSIKVCVTRDEYDTDSSKITERISNKIHDAFLKHIDKMTIPLDIDIGSTEVAFRSELIVFTREQLVLFVEEELYKT